MNEKDRCNVVAKAVRIEHDKSNNEVYLVFHITDEQFKSRIKKDWAQDIDLKIINRELYEFSE